MASCTTAKSQGNNLSKFYTLPHPLLSRFHLPLKVPQSWPMKINVSLSFHPKLLINKESSFIKGFVPFHMIFLPEKIINWCQLNWSFLLSRNSNSHSLTSLQEMQLCHVSDEVKFSHHQIQLLKDEYLSYSSLAQCLAWYTFTVWDDMNR